MSLLAHKTRIYLGGLHKLRQSQLATQGKMIQTVKDIRQKMKSVMIKDAAYEIHYNYLKNVESASVATALAK
jgi:hypothetical protein